MWINCYFNWQVYFKRSIHRNETTSIVTFNEKKPIKSKNVNEPECSIIQCLIYQSK